MTRNPDEIVRKGQRIYEETLRPLVAAGNTGRFLVINVETGEFVMDSDDVAVSEAAHQRFPGAPLYAMRIGYDAAYRLGGCSPIRTAGRR
jgi:hypothetical protein